MKLHINTDVPAILSLQAAAEALRVQEDFACEFEEIYGRCMEAARPKYCFAEFSASAAQDCTYIGDERFESRILSINLKGCSRAFLSLITCGREVYDVVKALEDPLEKYWADGIAEMLMAQAGAAMRREIQQITGRRICSISPGSLGDFPLIEQEKLFRLLGDSAAAIGVELTPSFLMIPQKSASAIYFESEEEYENCMLCLREGCSHRRAPFSEEAFIGRFALSEDDVRPSPGR